MKVYMVSLGCNKNKVESEMILGTIKKDCKLIDTPEDADLLIVNTCAFIEPARKEAIDTILEVSDYKKSGSKLIVCGCLPQRYKGQLEQLLPEVDRFISIDEYDNISKIIADTLKSNYLSNEEFSPFNRIYSTPNYMRYVKISDGCLNRCAFCAIPLIRGKLKSRTIEDIVKEVKEHVSNGVYEINLVSQDTTKYGFDIYKRLALVDLLKQLVKIDGDFKIRLLYLYPEIVTDELLEFIKTNPKMMHYFDIPIQHSETKILKKMLRRSDKDILDRLFHKIRNEISDAIIRTTVMVGFPYEEEEDVNNLIEFMHDIKFDRLGAFTFSLEEGTKACDYPNIISEAEKQRRYDLVMENQAKIALDINKGYINKILDDCFIINYDEQSYMYVARNYMFAPDDIDGVIYVASKEELNLGQRVSVKILDCDEYTLTGEAVYE
ncbi:MAG: 30S ribosomal protein S12 methylthiotransferase RimO [Acholeplasmatales bacterium]|nr:30S ribosomal protein S12 methylthiotransferase RimO [Acholeplasmatales bacterium]